MYLRFTTLAPDPSSHAPQGVFQAVYHLRDTGRLDRHEAARLAGDMDWLRRRLKVPAVLSRAGTHRAICWFHPQADEPIARVRSIVSLLELHGLHTRMVRTADPGTVLYEDDWQVVAVPRRPGSKLRR